MKTMIMYPTTATSLILGRRLLSNDHDISLYCPNEVHTRQAGTIGNDLKIAALGLTVKVDLIDTLVNVNDIDILVFPTLDMMPFDKRSDFGLMCRDLFR